MFPLFTWWAQLRYTSCDETIPTQSPSPRPIPPASSIGLPRPSRTSSYCLLLREVTPRSPHSPKSCRHTTSQNPAYYTPLSPPPPSPQPSSSLSSPSNPTQVNNDIHRRNTEALQTAQEGLSLHVTTIFTSAFWCCV